jgi:hypothetical protein
VEALRTEVPAAALPALGDLLSLLAETEATTLRKLATCAPGCISPDALRSARSALGGPERSGDTAPPSDSPTSLASPRANSRDGSRPAPSITVPGLPVQTPAGGGQPGAGPDGVRVGGDNGGATLSTGGATVNGPRVSASVPVVPSVTVVVPVPSVTVSDGVTVTAPPITAGGVTVPVPGVTVPLP